ncbi:MAG TPA: AMP-binding protein [Pyrinomonadaceae bacterium]|nr:AMP-binding protein [Pyrinomonadaceae bacterium]
MPERQSLLSYLDDYERRGRETVFVHHRGLRTVRWTYARLVEEAHAFARELQTRGIGSGDRVLLTGENSPEWAAAFWGCCLVGAVVVPLDKNSTHEFIDSVAKQTQARFIVDPLLNDISPLRDISLPKDLTQEAIVEIIYTSGTTSDPKGVVLTHQNLLANLAPLEREIRKYLKWERFFHPIRFLNLVPMSHVFGQFMGLFVPQLMGGEVHFQELLNPAEIVRTTRRNRISIIVAVPRVLDGLREWVERDFESKSSQDLDQQLAAMESHGLLRRWWTFRKVHRQFGWKFWAFVSGGATLSERTEDFWQGLGFAVSQGYGMTETAALISVNHPFKRSRGSIGRLMPGYEVKLDESGEIMVRGASVSPGYWTSEGRVTSRNGAWLRTGDVGQLDANGNLFFKGRQKDVIVGAAGLNIYPEDLEAALDRQPEIRASCVVAIEGAHGTVPFAAIIPHDSHADITAAIKRANEQLAEYQQVRQWSIWPNPDFPRTATHKILKREVASGLKSSSPNPSDVFSAASPATRLADLQLDSLGRVELLSTLEDRYQISLDEAAFTAATTIGDVQKLVRGEIHDQNVTPYPYPTWTQWRIVKLIRFVLFYTIILPITHVMSRMSVTGRENLNQLTGPALFIANHVSLADHALILAGLPFRLRHRLAVAMEGELLRNWIHPPTGTTLLLRLRWLAQYFLVNLFFHVFPLPKKSGFRRSFAYAGECIDRGISVLVFPEGTRAPRGQMHMGHFKPGIGLLAQSLNVPIVPIHLEGLYELKRRKQYFADPGMVRVIFGNPITFPTGTPPTEIAQDLEHLLS